MELVIPGLILVALMAWASTRIKRNAAAAFNTETIETDAFTLKKPSGWLSIVDPKDHLFEAYTKDYSAPPNEEIRLGTAQLDAVSGDFDALTPATEADATIIEERREVVADVHYRILELERESKDIHYREWQKLGRRDTTVYTLAVKTLAETTDELRRDIEGMLDSFELK